VEADLRLEAVAARRNRLQRRLPAVQDGHGGSRQPRQGLDLSFRREACSFLGLNDDRRWEGERLTAGSVRRDRVWVAGLNPSLIYAIRKGRKLASVEDVRGRLLFPTSGDWRIRWGLVGGAPSQVAGGEHLAVVQQRIDAAVNQGGGLMPDLHRT
jgi:hypothetical protein